jgi:hypothetical protein
MYLVDLGFQIFVLFILCLCRSRLWPVVIVQSTRVTILCTVPSIRSIIFVLFPLSGVSFLYCSLYPEYHCCTVPSIRSIIFVLFPLSDYGFLYCSLYPIMVFCTVPSIRLWFFELFPLSGMIFCTSNRIGGRRGRMGVGFTSTYAISVYHQ